MLAFSNSKNLCHSANSSTASGSSTDQKLMAMGKMRSLAFAVKIEECQVSQSIYRVCSSQKSTVFFPSHHHDQKLAVNW